jgi:hypothetical protein
MLISVDYSCGALSGRSTDGAGANVTIISDLHANARLTCSNGYGLPITVKMPPINDTNTRVTSDLYYTGDSTGTPGTDCFFFVSCFSLDLKLVNCNYHYDNPVFYFTVINWPEFILT